MAIVFFLQTEDCFNYSNTYAALNHALKAQHCKLYIILKISKKARNCSGYLVFLLTVSDQEIQALEQFLSAAMYSIK